MAALPDGQTNSQVRAASSDDDAETDNAVIDSGTDKQLRPGRLARLLENLRRTPTGRLAVKLVVIVAGTLVIALGLILVPLPGPGWLIVFAGLAIWSLEFRWAKRLSDYVRSRVSAWTAWYSDQRWPLRILIGFVFAVLVAAVIVSATYLSLGAAPFRRIGL